MHGKPWSQAATGATRRATCAVRGWIALGFLGYLAVWFLAAGKLLADEAMRVAVTPVRYAMVTRPVEASGRLVNQHELTLSFKTSGVVAAVEVHPGERVAEGDLLARLDPEESAAALNQAEARFVKAKRDLDRLQRLRGSQAVSEERLQNALTELQLAEAALTVARYSERHSTIVAPAPGVVLSRSAEPSEWVGPGQPVVALGLDGAGWVVRVSLTDREVVRVSLGDPADVVLDAYPGQRWRGVVVELGSLARATVGTFPAEVQLLDAPPRLSNGLFAQVRIDPQDDQRLARLPLAALVAVDDTQATLFRVDPKTRRVQSVMVPMEGFDDRHFFVNDAAVDRLAPGDWVVSAGAQFLRPGVEVQAEFPDTMAAPTAAVISR
ncbi:MAG: efflux RND transporter periplasmic adaptor subunit [Pseudomonadota bacterium]|nr:efflux RND transporter periplasmic adaptor subunit [Pseudomonadota bacterium]